MVDKIKKKKKSSGVARAQSLQAASAISSAKLPTVGRANDVRRSRQATRELNSEEREQLKKIMHEEAAKMFGDGHALPEKQKEIIERAVEMAIDSGAVEENS